MKTEREKTLAATLLKESFNHIIKTVLRGEENYQDVIPQAFIPALQKWDLEQSFQREKDEE